MYSKYFYHDGFSVKLSSDFPVGSDNGYGSKIQVSYVIKDNGTVIFSGDDLYMGIGRVWSSIQTVSDLAAFFARSELDCDNEWWDQLSDLQRAWCNSPRCDDFTSWGYHIDERA
jgi:hypothetical protein